MLGEKNNKILALIVLSFLGLVGNAYSVEMFFNVDFIFGSFFTMLGILFFGYYGIIPGFVASLYTYVLWNHPYAVIIFTAEVIFVARFRKKASIMMTDLFYWICCGIPIIYVTYHLIMGMNMNTTVLIMMKQSVNGVFGAMLAALVYDAYIFYNAKLGRVKGWFSFQYILFKIVAVVVIVPMIIYVMISVRSNMLYSSVGIKKSFTNVASASRHSLEYYLKEHIMLVRLLSQVIRNHSLENRDVELYQEELRNLLDANSSFLCMGRMGPDLRAEKCASGQLSVASKGVDGVRDLSFLDLSGIDWSRQEFYISDVHLYGDSAREKSVIYILKPLFGEKGEIIAYSLGVLDFDFLRNVVAEMTKESGVILTLLDRKDRIMFSTGYDYWPTDMWDDRNNKGISIDQGNGIYLWTPKPEKNVSVMTRWKKSVYTKTLVISNSIPFKLVADTPLSDYVTHMNQAGKRALTVIFFVMVLTVVSAHLLSRRVAVHLSGLSRLTKDLPQKVSDNKDIDWPVSIVEETEAITSNFKDMADELRHMFALMKKQKEELNSMIDAVPMMIFLKDTEDNITWANKKAAQVLRKHQSELTQATTKSLINNDSYFEDYKDVIRSKIAQVNILTRYNLKDGREIVARTSRLPLINEEGEVYSVLIVVDDITEEIDSVKEKQKMLEMLNHQAKMAEMGAMISIIVHQWKQPLNTIGLIAQYISEDVEEGKVKKEEIVKYMGSVMESVQFLSQTVSDFSDYFKESKSVSEFDLYSTLREVYHLIDRQFISNDILVELSEEKSFSVKGLKNDFKQICLNMLNNAKDALVASGVEDKMIKVTYRLTEDKAVITFADNGGGIRGDLLPDKLFEPYTSTKGEGGSGIGLYVCKNILQEKMNGSVTVENKDGGAVFTITIPVDLESTVRPS